MRQITHVPGASLEPRKKRDTENADAKLEAALVAKLVSALQARTGAAGQ